jgi:hypothetical protein
MLPMMKKTAGIEEHIASSAANGWTSILSAPNADMTTSLMSNFSRRILVMKDNNKINSNTKTAFWNSDIFCEKELERTWSLRQTEREGGR